MEKIENISTIEGPDSITGCAREPVRPWEYAIHAWTPIADISNFGGQNY